jgi:hypothetical protein
MCRFIPGDVGGAFDARRPRIVLFFGGEGAAGVAACLQVGPTAEN